MSENHDIDLGLLVALESLLEASNVTKAAKQLGVTQSAMSHKLRRLREMFGDPLLVGGRGGMLPTRRAQALQGPLHQALGQLRGLVRTGQPFDPATSRRRFCVVSSDYAEFGILPRVLEHCSQHAPDVSVLMREPWPGVDSALEDGSVDLMVGPQLPERAGLVVRTVAEEDLVCLVRKDHPRVGRKLDLKTYVQLHHVAIVPGGKPGSLVDEALASRGLSRKITMTVPHFLGAPFIAARSDLVLTAPRALAEHMAGILPLKIVEHPLQIPSTKIVMTWHERFSEDPGHQWMRELSRRCTEAIIASRRRRR